jgi:hypothetical protein
MTNSRTLYMRWYVVFLSGNESLTYILYNDAIKLANVIQTVQVLTYRSQMVIITNNKKINFHSKRQHIMTYIRTVIVCH